MKPFGDLEAQHGLPSGLLSAVMQQESGGNTRAVSPRGARGAFQFMPATAKQYGVDVDDMTSSATGAARMYADLLKQSGGDLPKALAGYNWGQGNVQRKGMDNMPTETRDYIQKVTANMKPQAANPFDQFDTPDANPFDQFDNAPQAAAPTPDRTAARQRKWSDVPMEALGNIPESAGDFVGGIYQAARHPIDTGKNLLAAAQGGAVNLMPDAYIAGLNKLQPGLAQKRAEVSQVGDAVGRFYKDRYGSMEGLKNTLATDPVGSLADVSTIFGGGAMIAPKASKAAGALRKASELTNPLSLASKSISKAAPYVGGKVADVIGGIGTHTGGESLRQAARSGVQGGQSAKTFTQNMRGNVPMTDVLDAAKANLDDMGRAKSAEYRAGMAQVSGDKTVLDFAGIDASIKNSAQTVTFKGQVKNQKAAEVLQKIADDVDQWKKLDPAQYHTPEGMDALKQRIGAMVESIPFEEKTARMVGNNIYHSIKGEITKQAPVYADVMKGYSEATDQIREIERALSLGGKSSVDTAMRKLQSLTRNNVNTNYGNRVGMARELEVRGGREIMPALAGQALNTWTPRGLGGAVAGGLGLGGYAVGGAPLAIPMLAAQSPRLMGEAALKAGQASRLVKQGSKVTAKLTGLSASELANMLYQVGRLPQE